MSWLADGLPRYKIAVCRGYAVNTPSCTTSGGARERHSYAVLDRARCHAIVGQFRDETDGARLSNARRGGNVALTAREQAEAVAADLNAGLAAA